MNILESIKQLTTEGLISILKQYAHIALLGDESRSELEQILQINVDEYTIDEIDIITTLGGE